MKTERRVVSLCLVCTLILGAASTTWSDSWKALAPLSQQSGLADTFVVFILNQDQFAGAWKQFMGELKKEWGEFTDDDLLQIEGKMDKFEGKMQERYGDRKEELKAWTDKWFERHTYETQSSSPNFPTSP